MKHIKPEQVCKVEISSDYKNGNGGAKIYRLPVCQNRQFI